MGKLEIIRTARTGKEAIAQIDALKEFYKDKTVKAYKQVKKDKS